MKRKKRMLAAAAALLLLLGAVFGGAELLERLQQGKLEEELRKESESLKASPWTADNTVTLDGRRYGFDHRMETFLFIGTDLSGNPDPENYYGPMADFLLLMVLDHTDDTVACLQIDRNTVTDVRELTKEEEEITSRRLQICTAHWYGRTPEMAARNTVYAVRQYLGGLGKIDGYFVMNMADVGRLNSSVGGVEVTVYDDLSGAGLEKGKTLTLSDEQAAAFLRARTGVGEGTNAERMLRQREYMFSFFQKVKEKTSEDPTFGLALWDLLRDAAVSDMNGNCFSRIAQKLLKGQDKGIYTVWGETVLGNVLQDGILHEEFYPAAGAVRDVMTELFPLVTIEEDKTGEDT